jgi:carboxyl-terminal processing protease
MTRFFRCAKLPAALLFLLLAVGAGFPTPQPAEGDDNRIRLLGYLLREQLPRHHYSHKPLDDDLSRAAFRLYLKQLDGQKRFLLRSDVKQLEEFATRIDDEINQGRISLPLVATEIMTRRVAAVEKLVTGMLTGTFDLNRRETFEGDPEKLEFCVDEAALAERWRQTLTYQVLVRYLNLIEDRAAAAKTAGKAVPAETGIDRKLLTEAQEKVAKSYRDFFVRVRQETRDDYFNRYFSAVTRAYDPHTDYLPPTEKEDFDIGMRGSLEGIGATLREEDGYIKVVAVIPGSAASRQGQLETEDVILKVAEGAAEPVDITDMRLRDAVGLIRGAKGTEVRLTVRKPAGRQLVIPIVRDVVQIEETFVKGAVVPDPNLDQRIGYIKIPSFYRDFQGPSHGKKGRNVTDDVRTQVQRLRSAGVTGLILDLRNDGGGSLSDAVSVAGLFIKTGPVVQVKNSNGEIETLGDDDPAIEYEGPLVVLVNQFSASASEILAGMLQDYGRALVVGAPTHGKGTVQALVDLDRSLPLRNMEQYKPLGALKITVQKFYRVSGASTQYRGVAPDIVLPDRLQYLKTGEQYADYSLPWDTVAAVAYSRWSRDGVRLEAIRNRSRQRTAADSDFAEIAAEAAMAKERSENTRQSLHLDEVRRERELARPQTPDETFHGESEDKSKEAPATTPAEKEAALVRLVLDNPYSREAMAILGDLAAVHKVPLSARNGAAENSLPH